MNNTLFINGQNEWVAGIFEKQAPAEYLTNWIYNKAPDEEKLPLLRDAFPRLELYCKSRRGKASFIERC